MTIKRVQPIRRKVRHLDWVMAWMVRIHPCAICGKSLSEGYNPRDPGKSITLHHTEGSREIDNWDDPDYVAKMVPSHKTCHRSYHLTKRHVEEGKNGDVAKLAKMEANIVKALKRQAVK
jgi:hypothetical protein